MAVSRATGDKAKADKLFSRIIRFHGVCDRCDKACSWDCQPQEGSHRVSCPLTCAHIITRHRSNTRTDLKNAFSLCASCHKHFELFPVSFGIFTLDRLSREEYDDLQKRAQQPANIDWSFEVERLRGEWAALRGQYGLD